MSQLSLVDYLLSSPLLNKLVHLEQPVPPTLDPEAVDPETIDAYYELVIACLMLVIMYPDLQRTLENYNAYDMLQELKTIGGKINKDKNKTRGAKGSGKGKGKQAYASKPKIPPPPKKENPTKDSICHHCKEVGNWRRKCPAYFSGLRKKKNTSVASFQVSS
ncbi:zinc finger, CCHC-type containing protein [Tanacetum coccineum]